MLKCAICGKDIEQSLYSDTPLCSDKCSSKNFWKRALDESAIIINGVCYHDGGYGGSENGFKGFAGQLFHIRDLRTGKKFKTDNLWYNGAIPDDMVKDYPDTHEFIKESVSENPICCFCGNVCENEWGNNPDPVNVNPQARCCDACNMSIVIPARLKAWKL